MLTGAEVARRFPAYALPADMEVAYQPDGGFVTPERCIVAHVEGALARGATIRARERVLDWAETENGVRVRTDRGEVEAERHRLRGRCVVAGRRAASGREWFEACASRWRGSSRRRRRSSVPDRMPVFNLALDGEHFYGFPAHGIPGFKLGRYDHFGPGGDPDEISREPTLEDEAPLQAIRGALLPGRRRVRRSRSRPASSSRHPTSTSSSIDIRTPRPPSSAAGFSGHGYKFCSVVGEILADLALEGETRHDIELFRLDRF